MAQQQPVKETVVECSVAETRERENHTLSDIEDLENFFLQGSFRDSLQLANEFLLTQSKAEPQISQDYIYRPIVLTPLYSLSDSFGVRSHSFHLSKNSDDCDRAAAIALQSWYELLQLSKSQPCYDDIDEFQFLRPFLQLYSASTDQAETTCQHRAMSVELLLIWIHLCRSLGQIDTAIDASVRLLLSYDAVSAQTLSMSIHADLHVQCFREILLLLCSELLPYSTDSHEVSDVLQRLIESDPEIKYHHDSTGGALAKFKLSDAPQKRSVQLCLEFCTTNDGGWPDVLQTAFVECRIVLQAMLQKLHQRSLIQYSESNRIGNTKLIQASNLSFPSFKQTTKKEDRLNREKSIMSEIRRFCSSVEMHLCSEDGLKAKRKIKSVFFAICLLFVWRRHRQRIVAAGRHSLNSAVGQVLIEIVEALGFAR